MKKFLLGTTAIVTAAAVTAPAVAAEKITLGLGGYMESYVGFVSNEKDAGVAEYRNFDVQTDYEVWFQGATTLDNGIKFSVKVEMEADGEDTGGTIDEAYVEVSSASFGSLKIGYDDMVTSLGHHEGPNYGISTTEIDSWIVNRGTAAAWDSYIQIGQGDEAKISYFTPSFAGFQLGATYVPELENRTASGQGTGNAPWSAQSVTPNSIGGGGDAWAAILAYNNTFGGLGVGADIGYARATGGVGGGAAVGATSVAGGTVPFVQDASGYQAGLTLSYAGFQFGGAYEKSMIDYAGAGNVNSADGYTWQAGVGYKTGPWGVSLTYAYSVLEGAINTRGEDSGAALQLGGVYNLGPGINLQAALIYADYDNEDGNAVDSTFNNGGWGFVTGFQIAF